MSKDFLGRCKLYLLKEVIQLWFLPKPTKPSVSEVPVDDYVVVKFSGVTLKLTKEFVESFGRSVLPVLLSLAAALGGTAGVNVWLQQQPNAPTVPKTEDICP